ncbi:MAG: nucleoside triphosphate pyrophosphohydrolase [Crenarchaeota archaeon]|nr:nucleoside triphosphate pyrophosphohydrolase [Thermoproteota archaeon]
MPCWKLVRDRIAEKLRGQPGVHLARAGEGELEPLLRAKIVEEAMELAETGSLEEAADLLEALEAWLRLRGSSLDEARRLAAEKRRRRGGFDGGWVAVWENC